MDDAIRKRIEESGANALTLDTNVFERHRFNFDERGMLDKVARIKGCGVRLLMPDVVLGELNAHVRARATQAAIDLQTAAGRAQRLGALAEQEHAQLVQLGERFVDDAAERASRRLYTWIETVGVEIVEADDYVTPSDVTTRYFAGEPPFETGGPKKHEFPDALALLALEGWADEQGTAVLAVSHDQGWMAYSATSNNVIVTQDLGAALAVFQQPTAENASRALFSSLTNGDLYNLKDELREALNHQGAIDVMVDADSQFEVRDAEGYPTFTDIEFPDPGDGVDGFEAVSLDEGAAVVRIRATATAEVEIFLSFAKWDSGDKEYMDMGSAKLEQEHDVEIEALVTLTGQIPTNMTIEHVEVLPLTLHVRINDAEPDWMANAGGPDDHD